MNSSISSSDTRDVVTLAPGLAGSGSSVRRLTIALRRLSGRLPLGGLLAVLLVVLIHLGMACLVVPEPVPRSDLRKKILGLTAQARPAVVFAGDSRTYFGIDPILAAEELGLPKESTVNVGLSGCEVVNVRLGLDLYANRFRPEAIAVINVSPFTVNDDSTMLENETLWMLDRRDQISLAGLGRTVRLTFLPELSWLSFVKPGAPNQLSAARNGHMSLENTWTSNPEQERLRLDQLWNKWFGRAEMRAKRWALFEDSIRRLQRLGYQVVLTSPPIHPAVEAYDTQRQGQSLFREFEHQVADFANEHGIPWLVYRARRLDPDDPGSVMNDLTHVNTKGARLLTECLSCDLRTLIDEGRLHVPGG